MSAGFQHPLLLPRSAFLGAGLLGRRGPLAVHLCRPCVRVRRGAPLRESVAALQGLTAHVDRRIEDDCVADPAAGSEVPPTSHAVYPHDDELLVARIVGQTEPALER